MGNRKNKKKNKINLLLTQEERSIKAKEAQFQATLLGLDKFIEFKRMKIILDLWVKFGREHQEIIDLPMSNSAKKLEITLFNSCQVESSVILKN